MTNVGTLFLVRLLQVLALAGAAHWLTGPAIAGAQADTSADSPGLRATWQSGHPGIDPTATPPVITAAKITTATVDVTKAPASPVIATTFKAPLGLQSIAYSIQSPSGNFTLYFAFGPGNSYLTKGVAAVEQPFIFNLYDEPGAWKIIGMTICDLSGNCVTYPPSIFLSSTTINVINNSGFADTTGASVSHGKMLTPIVHLATSPVFQFSLRLSDAVAGVSNINMNIQWPGASSPNYYSMRLPSPVKTGTVASSILLPANAPTGVYTIEYISVFSPSGGYFSPGSVQSLFGTDTFTVMK